jgi:hypothetical protein
VTATAWLLVLQWFWRILAAQCGDFELAWLERDYYYAAIML